MKKLFVIYQFTLGDANKRLIKKLKNILYKKNIFNAVLSNQLAECENLKNELYFNNINIISGKNLFKYLEFETIQYIVKKQNININEAEVTILVNDNSDINLMNIELIAKTVRQVNIVTNHIDKFKYAEDFLLNKYGITLKITNNYQKAISNSKIILNIDFPEEVLLKYKIYQKAIIISLHNEIKKVPKKFSGIIIKNLKLKIPDKYKKNLYNNEEIYESNIYKTKGFNDVRKKMKKDRIDIDFLIGINGKINSKEIAKIS